MTGRLSNIQQKISLFSPRSNSPWLGDLLFPLSLRHLKSTAQFPTNSTCSLREPAVRTSQALLKLRQVSRDKLPFQIIYNFKMFLFLDQQTIYNFARQQRYDNCSIAKYSDDNLQFPSNI